MRPLAILIGLFLAACAPNETLTQYGGDSYRWKLVELDGSPVTYTADMQFGPRGAVTGNGPCNPFRATQTAPYPWFALEMPIVGDVACDLTGREQEFMHALWAMSLVEISGNVLVLRDEAGREMVFSGQPRAG